MQPTNATATLLCTTRTIGQLPTKKGAMRRVLESTTLAALVLGGTLVFAPGCLGDENMEDATGAMPEGSSEDAVTKLPPQIPHDQVKPFPTDAPAFTLHYQPLLKVRGGCVPFAAVQADGKWSGGLESSGSENGGCSKSTGQVYVRFEKYENRGCAVMYSWYFPKDGNIFAGHRHDWEAIVVWLKECSADAGDPIAVAYSQHGGWYVEKGADVDLNKANGKVQPKVEYHKSTLFTDYELNPTRDAGGMQPLVGWNNLTAAARETLNRADFGKAIVPFKDSKFHTNIGNAKYW